MEKVTTLRSRRFTNQIAAEHGLPGPSVRRAFDIVKQYEHYLELAAELANPESDFRAEDRERISRRLSDVSGDIQAMAEKQRDPIVRHFAEYAAGIISGVLTGDQEIIDEINAVRRASSG